MKRLSTLLIIILLLFATSAYTGDMQLARTNPYVAGSAGAAAALTCSELTQQSPTDMVTRTGDKTMAHNSDYYGLASRFLYGGVTGGEPCSLYVMMYKVGLLSGKTLTLAIWSDDGDATPLPVSSVVSCGSMSADDLGTSDSVWVKFTCSGGTLTNNTYYWVVATVDSVGDTLNKIQWSVDNTAATVVMASRMAAATWYDESTAYTGTMKLYIKE